MLHGDYYAPNGPAERAALTQRMRSSTAVSVLLSIVVYYTVGLTLHDALSSM